MASTELGDHVIKQEAPEKGSQEVGETRAEPLEAPEEIKRVEQATFEPEAVIEREGDYKQAEAIETAFVELIVEPELAPAPGGLMPASIELEVPEVQEVQPALSDASDIQPPTSGLPGLSEVGLETVGDGFVPLGESESSISPGSSDRPRLVSGQVLTLEAALTAKPTLETEIPEASIGEEKGVPFDPVKIVSEPESGGETQTPVVGTADVDMDAETFVETTPEMTVSEAMAEAEENAAEVEPSATETEATDEVQGTEAQDNDPNSTSEITEEVVNETVAEAVEAAANAARAAETSAATDDKLEEAKVAEAQAEDEMNTAYAALSSVCARYGNPTGVTLRYSELWTTPLNDEHSWLTREGWVAWLQAKQEYMNKYAAHENAVHATREAENTAESQAEQAAQAAAEAEAAAAAALAALTPLMGADAAERVLSEALGGEETQETNTGEAEPTGEADEDASTD